MATLPEPPMILFQQQWQNETVQVVAEQGTHALYFSNKLTQSRMLIADPFWLILPYSHHIMASLLFTNNPSNCLMVGLGGGSLAKFLWYHFPDCQLDVVEKNPEMETIAQNFFHLPTDDRLKIHCDDGGHYIEKNHTTKKQYDLLLIDAFDHVGMATSVYSKRFFEQIKAFMTQKSILALNLTRGEAALYKTMLSTLSECFPNQVYQLPVRDSNNEILFCRMANNPWHTTDHHAKAHQLAELLDLNFPDYLERITPLKQTFWQSLNTLF